jgi:hypothetical protein
VVSCAKELSCIQSVDHIIFSQSVWCPDSGSCQGAERCWNVGNPGFGYHGFDNIFMAWATIFIWMTQLYWWETASAIENTNYGISSSIAWYCGFFIVILLAFLAVNMFVAVRPPWSFNSVICEKTAIYPWFKRCILSLPPAGAGDHRNIRGCKSTVCGQRCA